MSMNKSVFLAGPREMLFSNFILNKLLLMTKIQHGWHQICSDITKLLAG